MGSLDQHTNYKAYARCIPDRLISGLLTVNIRNAYDNSDGLDDVNDVYYTKWDSDLPTAQKVSNPFGNNKPAAPATDRTGACQSFGDFDCFLFWVSGGMTLHSTLTYGTTRTNPAGYANTSGTWYESISDPRCNSYIRSQLIGRSNNAYTPNANYFQAGHENMINLRENENANVDSNTEVTSLGADGIHKEHVLNTTTYSSAHSAHDNKWSLESPTNNKFYSPVKQISITGSHRLNTTSNAYSGSGGTDYGTLYQLSAHDSSFYSIVVDIVLFGYHTSGAGGGTGSIANKIRTDYNINVFFQPFGETPNLDFAVTEWAS